MHVGLILWSGAGAGMAFFWVGIVFTYLIALFSLARLRDAIGQRLWRISLVIALNYIALVFVADFIGEPLKKGGITSYPLSYLPFALMLIVGVGLRAATFVGARQLINRILRLGRGDPPGEWRTIISLAALRSAVPVAFVTVAAKLVLA